MCSPTPEPSSIYASESSSAAAPKEIPRHRVGCRRHYKHIRVVCLSSSCVRIIPHTHTENIALNLFIELLAPHSNCLIGIDTLPDIHWMEEDRVKTIAFLSITDRLLYNFSSDQFQMVQLSWWPVVCILTITANYNAYYDFEQFGRTQKNFADKSMMGWCTKINTRNEIENKSFRWMDRTVCKLRALFWQTGQTTNRSLWSQMSLSFAPQATQPSLQRVVKNE